MATRRHGIAPVYAVNTSITAVPTGAHSSSLTDALQL
eukprot:CAMPEP_0178518392 /NCGR_PEP_ID=MMETSP0696-20121128/26234_1 /TAXON_ID=265572 /ORGANISM="Extubocellulus spinifer, Strain CCMP396" /LENGTH=36 /DNA_ID= /DNA_START= /DNA_END= /DNA_ORIENTATION=